MLELLVLPSLYTALILTGDNPQTREASYYASLAYYKQSGLEEEVEPQFRKFEDKYIPQTMQQLGIGSAMLYRIVIDHKLELAWSF